MIGLYSLNSGSFQVCLHQGTAVPAGFFSESKTEDSLRPETLSILRKGPALLAAALWPLDENYCGVGLVPR